MITKTPAEAGTPRTGFVAGALTLPLDVCVWVCVGIAVFVKDFVPGQGGGRPAVVTQLWPF